MKNPTRLKQHQRPMIHPSIQLERNLLHYVTDAREVAPTYLRIISRAALLRAILRYRPTYSLQPLPSPLPLAISSQQRDSTSTRSVEAEARSSEESSPAGSVAPLSWLWLQGCYYVIGWNLKVRSRCGMVLTP